MLQALCHALGRSTALLHPPTLASVTAAQHARPYERMYGYTSCWILFNSNQRALKTHSPLACSSLVQAVREQIRKLAVGGPPGKDTAVYQVSDSEDEDLDDKDLLGR